MSVVAYDVLAAVPLDPFVREALEAEHGFSGDYLEEQMDWHEHLITVKLGRMGLAMRWDQSVFDSPLEKLAYDTSEVVNLMRMLGPTNPLRNPEGYDAGFDFARIIRLLEQDYAAMPEADKNPSLRMTEAVLREELALLWRPFTPVEFAGHRHAAFMFDLDDPNVPGLQDLSPPDRWKYIGAKLSDEAAGLFKEIYESPQADKATSLEACCRMVDMQVRSLRIQASMTNADREGLYRHIDSLNTDYMSQIDAVWDEPVPRGIRDGLLAELTVVGVERERLIRTGQANQIILLTGDIKDRPHQMIGPLRNEAGEAMSLGVDVAEVDMNGTFIQGWQVKRRTQESYDAQEARRQRTGRTLRRLPNVHLRLMEPEEPQGPVT